MSASQEINVLSSANRLKKLIVSLGFQPPLRLLAYNCAADLTPLGMVMLGYQVHAVNSDPVNTQHIQQYVALPNSVLSCASYPILKVDERESQAFDVAVIEGCVITDLRLDSQLAEVCRQLAVTLRPDGLLVITKADFDETLRTREQVLRPHLTDDHTGRQLEVTVRDWHGNGYEYTETGYRIMHGDGAPTITSQAHERRAWRNAELVLALAQAGFQTVQWQPDDQYGGVLTAVKQSETAAR